MTLGSSSTHNYLSAANNLKPLTSDKMYASGFELTLRHLGKEEEEGRLLVEIQFAGDFTDELKKVIEKSITHTLTLRKVSLTSELASITNFLKSNQ